MRESDIEHDLPKTEWHQEIRLTRGSSEILTAVGECLHNGGLTVLLKQSVFNGEQLILDTVLPNHAAHRLEPIRMRCRVSYLVALTHPPDTLRAGLTIEQIDARHRQSLLRFAWEQVRHQRSAIELYQSDNG